MNNSYTFIVNFIEYNKFTWFFNAASLCTPKTTSALTAHATTPDEKRERNYMLKKYFLNKLVH